MKVLIIASRFPFPLEKGDKLRLYHQIRQLHGKVSMTLAAISDVDVEKEEIRELSRYVDKCYVFRLTKRRIIWENLTRFFFGMPFQVLYFYNRKIHQSIREIIQNEKPDVVYCQLVRSAEYARDYSGPKVLDYMDAFSYGMGKRVAGSSLFFKLFYSVEQKRLNRYEQEIFSCFDAHTIISEQDKNRILPGKNHSIQVIPNGVDTTYFQPVKSVKKYHICFVGNMGYRPNIDAAEYLCQQIVPEVRKKIPDLKILLAGARPHRRVKALANDHVEVSGWMEDIRVAYDSSRLFVAPIFSGIGQQNKVLEAMSMEMPCICTSAVNHPIGSENGKEVFIADTVNDFSEYIIRLLDDETMAQQTGQNARKFVADHYAWNKQLDRLVEIFREVKKKSLH